MISFQPPIQVCRGAYIAYFKIKAPIFCCSIFSEECLNPHVWINKMVNGHTVDYHPIPSELISRIHPLIFLWTPQGFISPEYSLNFFCNLYIPPWLQQSFKFMVLRLLENEMNLFILLMPQAKHFSRFYRHHSRQKEITHFPQTTFFENLYCPAERGRIMKLGKWPKLNLHGYWSQVLINSTIFATITFLVPDFLCHSLDSSMLKCEGYLT